MSTADSTFPVRWTEPQPKPVKGSAHAERVGKRKAVESHEAHEKALARRRDGRCRWPSCDCGARRDRLEVAHIDDKGMGGDHGHRSSHDRLIVLCLARHQGRPSLHSGDLVIEPLTASGTNGPCALYATDAQGQKYIVAQERAPFVYERD